MDFTRQIVPSGFNLIILSPQVTKEHDFRFLQMSSVKAVANFYDRKSKENANKIKTVAAFSPKNRQENKKIYSCRMMSLSRKKTHVGILDLRF